MKRTYKKPPSPPYVCSTAGSDFLGDNEMSGADQCSSQPQFMTSVGRSNRSNGPGTPLIESIDVDQIVIPEVWFSCLILEKEQDVTITANVQVFLLVMLFLSQDNPPN